MTKRHPCSSRLPNTDINMSIQKLPLLGQQFTTRNRAVHNNTLINYYCEMITREDSAIGPQPTPAVTLYPTPGTALAGSVSSKNQVRGMIFVGGFLWVVIDSGFYKGTQNLTTGAITFGSSLGTLSTSTGQVSLCSSGALSSQIFIADGTASKKYYNYLTSTFGAVVDAAATVTSQADYQDGYASYVDITTNRFWITDVGDLSNVTGTNFASLTTKCGNAVAIKFFKQYLCAWSIEGVEVWFNAGTLTITGAPTTFPWQRVADVYMDKGTLAPFSIVSTDTALFWLSANLHGDSVIVRAGGTLLLTPEIITTPAITSLLDSIKPAYATAGKAALSDCQGYCYQAEGHEFIVWTFPIGNLTIVYDNFTKMWNVWATGTVANFTGQSTFGRHISNCYCYMNGYHYVGDYATGQIYMLKFNTLTDYNAQTIYREVTSSYLADMQKRISVPRLELDITAAPAGSGSITLYTSKDGGTTFVSQGAMAFDSTTPFTSRTFWTLLGFARDWSFKLVCSSPVSYVIGNLIADVEEGDC